MGTEQFFQKLLASDWLQRWMARSICLPAPDGPFSVGTREFTLTDFSRVEKNNTPRKIGLKAWYPAEPSSLPYETYLADEEMAQMHAGEGANYLVYLTHLPTHAQPMAAFAPHAIPSPVILFSHGHSLSNRSNSLVCESLASWGYTLLAVGHTGEGCCTLIDEIKIPMDKEIMSCMRAEGEQIRKESPGFSMKKNASEFLRRWILQGKVSRERLEVWTRDLQYVADWVDRNEDDFFKDRLHTNRFAVFGHSFGGAASIRVLHYDSRFVCAVNMDGAQFGGDFLEQEVVKPAMVLARNPLALRSGYSVSQRGMVWLGIPSANHLNFTDGSLVYGCIPRLLGLNGRINSKRMIVLMRAILRSFFDQYYLGIGHNFYEIIKKFPEIHRTEL